MNTSLVEYFNNLHVFLLNFASRSSKHVDIRGNYYRVPTFPPDQVSIARVNHNKYIVTDQSAMNGTSNWTPEYFLNIGGIGFMF